ncbi:hypothetical protein DSO57_1009194 [Entomophthora muscae]|uniref:Uncharacterized protein n=1 Tax=Entomophthora muscae TaxID=34485 RepID=A0ACC2U591_9FUNG|nr:hypothetical protein DSO57_1009194 [Entomophthora muscae]
MISRGELDFNQCSVKVICAELPTTIHLTTPPPPALAALLKEYKDVFSETLDQLPPSQEIQHAVCERSSSCDKALRSFASREAIL